MGEEAKDVLTSTNITEDEKKSYEGVLGKFNDYFKVRKNVILRGPGLTAETNSKENQQNNT